MTIDEQRTYLEQTLRKAPEGSARRIWAAAQLAKLKLPQATNQPTAKSSRKVYTHEH